MFAWHRTAVAGATYSEGSCIAVAMFGNPVQDMKGYSCSLAPTSGRLKHQLIWPEAESPAVYTYRDSYGPAYESERMFMPDERFTASAYLLIKSYAQPHTACRTMLDFAWRMHELPTLPRLNFVRIWELGIAYAKESLWAEDGDFRGFAIGMKWKEGKWVQHRL